MPPKREQNLNIRLSEYEKEQIRQISCNLGENESDIIRMCIAIAVPILEAVPYVRRVRLEDNEKFKEKQ